MKMEKMSRLSEIKWAIKKRIIAHMPRWLADCGFRYVLDHYMKVGDWESTTVDELYERWYMK